MVAQIHIYIGRFHMNRLIHSNAMEIDTQHMSHPNDICQKLIYKTLVLFHLLAQMNRQFLCRHIFPQGNMDSLYLHCIPTQDCLRIDTHLERKYQWCFRI